MTMTSGELAINDAIKRVVDSALSQRKTSYTEITRSYLIEMLSYAVADAIEINRLEQERYETEERERNTDSLEEKRECDFIIEGISFRIEERSQMLVANLCSGVLGWDEDAEEWEDEDD